MRGKISIAASEPWLSAYPATWGARVSVTMNDGASTETERHGAAGDPELALDDRQMLDKARMLLDTFVRKGRVELRFSCPLDPKTTVEP